MRYRSKPQEVEAIQWAGDNAEDVGRIAPYKFATAEDEDGGRAWLKAGADGAQGWVDVPVGHWIVRSPGDVTDLWPVDPGYFAKKYIALDVEDGDSDDRTTQWRGRAEEAEAEADRLRDLVEEFLEEHPSGEHRQATAEGGPAGWCGECMAEWPCLIERARAVVYAEDGHGHV